MKTPRHRAAHDRIGTGGSIERDLIRRYLNRRMAKIRLSCLGSPPKGTRSAHEYQVLARTLLWLNKQPERTAQPGGIGR